jgi:hypothetical protein
MFSRDLRVLYHDMVSRIAANRTNVSVLEMVLSYHQFRHFKSSLTIVNVHASAESRQISIRRARLRGERPANQMPYQPGRARQSSRRRRDPGALAGQEPRGAGGGTHPPASRDAGLWRTHPGGPGAERVVAGVAFGLLELFLVFVGELVGLFVAVALADHLLCDVLTNAPCIRLTAAKMKAADQPHISMPVNPSTPAARRHCCGGTKSP